MKREDAGCGSSTELTSLFKSMQGGEAGRFFAKAGATREL
jgi:hypothetical protein